MDRQNLPSKALACGEDLSKHFNLPREERAMLWRAVESNFADVLYIRQALAENLNLGLTFSDKLGMKS